MRHYFIYILLLSLFSVTHLGAGERASRNGTIGKSSYAHEPFPECPTGIDVKGLTASAAAISAFMGYSDAGLIALGGEVFAEVRRHGGAISKFFSKLEGGSKSACVAICIAPPSGEDLNWANFCIDGSCCRHNGTVNWTPGSSGQWIECGKGWAGLRSFSVSSSGACGVFANWKHDWTRDVSVIIDYGE